MPLARSARPQEQSSRGPPGASQVVPSPAVLAPLARPARTRTRGPPVPNPSPGGPSSPVRHKSKRTRTASPRPARTRECSSFQPSPLPQSRTAGPVLSPSPRPVLSQSGGPLPLPLRGPPVLARSDPVARLPTGPLTERPRSTRAGVNRSADRAPPSPSPPRTPETIGQSPRPLSLAPTNHRQPPVSENPSCRTTGQSVAGHRFATGEKVCGRLVNR